MRLVLLPAMAVLLLSACSHTRDARSVLLKAEKAMGDVKSIQFSATGVNGNFGQALDSDTEWPLRNLTAYSRTINYEQKSAAEQIVFAHEVFGGQKQNAVVNGDEAWSVGPNGPVPQLAASEERQLQIWMTPHGFIKAGLAAGDAEYSETKYDGVHKAITFTVLGKYKLSGRVNDSFFVTRVETHEPNPVLGDLPVFIEYLRYKDFNGTMFPAKIIEGRGGFAVWNLDIADVRVNVPADLPVPEVVRNASAAPASVESIKLADGVWFLGGGSHHSVLVEFKDYLAVIEAPLNEERSLAVVAEARRLVTDKPVKYVISTHHHFDHIGGLRTYVAQGATIITDESNKEYFDEIFRKPAKIAPDLLSKNPKPPLIQAVAGKYVLTDGKQTIEVYSTEGDTHSYELLLAYLPGPEILVEADSYSPGAPNSAPSVSAPPNAVTLFDNIQRLKLNVATIAPIHGRGPVPIAEFKKFIGKS